MNMIFMSILMDKTNSRSTTSGAKANGPAKQSYDVGCSEGLRNIFCLLVRRYHEFWLKIIEDLNPMFLRQIAMPSLYELTATETKKYSEEKQRGSNKIDEWKPVIIGEI